MSEHHPTAPAASVKPAKPYPEFPLTAHPAGYWCKKIRGKLHYFGPWDDPDGALAKYLEQKDDLHAGSTSNRCATSRRVSYGKRSFTRAGDSAARPGSPST